MTDPYIEMDDGTPTFKGNLGPQGGKVEKEIVCFPEHVFDRMEKKLR